MNVEFDKSFNKALKNVSPKSLFPKIEAIIHECETANSIQEISHIRKLSGYAHFYRIRIGIEIIHNTITFITIAHRKDIYKKFP